MHLEQLNDQISVSGQITAEDVGELKSLGVDTIVCNRPDGEDPTQPQSPEIKAAAEALGMRYELLPFTAGNLSPELADQFAQLISSTGRIHAYCRTGNRSKQLYKAASGEVIQKDHSVDQVKYDVVIVGAGSAGIATAASLHKRLKNTRIALIDPSEDHYYQPGWTMVGGGVFSKESTARKTQDLIPDGCTWIRDAVTAFEPTANKVSLASGASVYYTQLIVAPGLTLNWAGIEGLEETLGKNGVTSNYRYDLAPYTWELVQKMESGKAIFTQPPMPIKCAGAPQKALYLSASEWLKRDKLTNISIDFYNSGGALFGVADYVPALMEYIKKYNANLNFGQTLIKVDGEAKTAWFRNADGEETQTQFDFLHVCPPQTAPEFIRTSELADDAGWLDVDPATLRSKRFNNVWGVGDVMNTSNAKTMAAARKQAPVVAHNVAAVLNDRSDFVQYDGYGSCPLTVEHGKIVLAEFTYGGKVAPTFPSWLNEGTRPSGFAWFLKAHMLPPIYWHGMLKGREWMAGPAS